MHELQEFQQVFEITFPVQLADQVLAHMETIYGSDFNKKYGHIEASVLCSQVCAVLNGITPSDLRSGVNRMNREKWCPSLPELRSWCEGNDFWTANQAWAKATTFLDNPKTAITVFTKQALDDVRLILQNEGQQHAGFAFRDIYKGLVDDAKENGLKQQMWDRQNELPEPPQLISVSKVLLAMSDTEKRICERQAVLMAKGLTPKAARIQAQNECESTKRRLINKAQDKSILMHSSASLVLTPFQQMVSEGKSAADAFKACQGGVA